MVGWWIYALFAFQRPALGPSNSLWCPSICCKRSGWTNSSFWKSRDSKGKSRICTVVCGAAGRKLIQEMQACTACKFQKKTDLFYLRGENLELQRQANFIGVNCYRFIIFCSALTTNSAWSGPSAFFFSVCDVHCFHDMVRAIVLPSNKVCISCSNYWSN